MKFAKEDIYHIYNQGNNRQVIFYDEGDYFTFLRLLNNTIKPQAEIIAWCLMPSHFHLLVYTDDRSVQIIKQGGLFIESLTNGVRKLLSGYTRIFNKKYERTGSLFRQKTKAKNISETETVLKNRCTYTDYCRSAFWYIHQNPVEAGIVTHPADWRWSSYLDYAGKRNGKLVNKSLAKKFCDYNLIDFQKRDNILITPSVKEDFD